MIHHGHNVKRIREILGVKQDSLASSMGLSQQSISQLEQKEIIDASVLEKVSKVLGVSEDTIKNFSDESAINIVANTINNHDQSSVLSYRPTFNPIDRIISLYDEKIALYERMLEIEREKIDLLMNKIG